MEKERKRLLIILIIGFVSALMMLFFSNMVFFENIEHKVDDFKFSVRGINEMGLDESKVIIVAIDDQSFASIPYKYPWPNLSRDPHQKSPESWGSNDTLRY
jgi:CHASE2 domain-containing sensor protein